jgi:amino acid permease
MSDIRFAALTSVIIIGSYLVAMTVNSLEAVLSYVGSTGSTSLSFILPGLFYYSISHPDSPSHQRLTKTTDDGEYLDGDDDEYYDEEDEIDTEHNPLLSTSIASLNSLSRSARRAAKKVWPKDLLRKLSLALAIYGFLVMFVCLGVNVFKHSQGG